MKFNFLQSAYRTSKRHAVSHSLRAAVVTAIVPAAAAALLIWLAPQACGVWLNHSSHRWMCLLPGLLLFVPLVTAILMTIFTVFNQRLERPFPNGWLVSVLTFGLVNQILFIGAYLVALGPGYLGPFLAGAIFIPQPFLAGAIAAAVYWIVLHWRK